MARSRIGLLLLTFFTVSCGESGDSLTGGDGGGTSDPVDLIVNSATRASASTHWDPNQWSVPGNTYAFFADGTGAFSGVDDVLNPVDIDFTWTKIGPASLVVVAPAYLGFGSMSFIEGSVALGEFTTRLDGNPTVRTFAIQGGGLPGGSP